MPDNQYQELFDRQKRTFASGVTRTYEWRVEYAQANDELNEAIGQ